jgi:hypothetical protein
MNEQTQSHLLQTPLFVQFLASVAALPSDDPAWDELDDLARSLHMLQGEHTAQARLNQHGRTQLAAALTDLFALHSEQLSFFGIDPYGAWSTAVAAPALLDSITLDVTTLTALLLEHAQVEARSRESLTQRRTLRGELERIEREAEAIWARGRA